MNRQRTKLSDEHLADLLSRPHGDGEGADDTDLLDLKTALASYRSETLQWAERRSATQPSLVPAARRSRMWAAVPQWSLAAIAAVTIATGAVRLAEHHPESSAASSAAAMPVQVHPSAEQIEADNQLLTSIDAALSYHNDTPVAELGLRSEVQHAADDNASEVF